MGAYWTSTPTLYLIHNVGAKYPQSGDIYTSLPLDELAEADPCNLTGQITIDLSRRTGWGRFGDVYKGEYEGSNVCVKVLREVSVADADRLKKFFRRLKREIKVWHKMGDDNVIAFLGWTLQPVDGSLRVSLVSQWADGGNVTEFLRQNPDADRLGIVRGVCRGLAHLHSCGVVHGDIKPENVVVSSSTQTGPKPKLCDFRLSSVVDDFTTRAKAPSTMGTIRYTSPELMDGTVTGRDENSDVWAFGCTAAQILTSQVPYAWVSHQLQLSSAICQGPPYDVSNNTEFFANCIAACFESRRELRPSVAKLIQWLELEPGSLTSVSLINSLPRVIVMLHMLSLLQRLDDLPYLWRYQRNRDIAGLDAEFRKAIPVPVQTECCEWYRIIFRCSAGDINALDAFKMVVPLLLHWICAMSIMGKLEEALVGLYEMKNYTVGDRTFGTLLCELHRMILQSRAAIRACSLSILGGLHPFVPWRSALRSYFPQMFSKGLLALIAPGFTRPDAEWPPLSQRWSNLYHGGSPSHSHPITAI
ncbi:uncharacterized protein EI90DRAFT_3170803 [Cantharellus anzutake]|uniref:uncharacterized protein n=1 Tax=Cantharellus anzutake TaxID=1750568 RepID=UPI001906899D|nr:uncharacterized protein EI90DRAFT_3170803 [Cantharellus anzutake]KAF8317036.1 hypothetical protein EI90DRAFT_3170803 [Cantharellus anzutake]